MMASSSSQSGMNIDKNRELEIVPQGRDQIATSSMAKEKESTEEKKDLNWYLPLHRAVLKLDWESARSCFDKDPDAKTAKITITGETVLHLAAGTEKAIHFLKNLLELIPTEALLIRDIYGNTALHRAAEFGNVEGAKLLVDKNPEMTNTSNNYSSLPLHLAAHYGQKETVSYLITVTPDDFSEKYGMSLLKCAIDAECYDVALNLVRRNPSWAVKWGNTALSSIAMKPDAFPSGYSLNFWKRLIYSYVDPTEFENFINYSKGGGGDMENPAASSQVLVRTRWWIRFFRGHNFSVFQKLHALFQDAFVRIVPEVKDVRDAKLMHYQTLQLVRFLCKEITSLDYRTAESILTPPIISAARLGISEIVEEILDLFPSAIWATNEHGQNIFSLAVENRRENIFNLVYQMSERKRQVLQLIDKQKNTVLHMAGKLAPPSRLGFFPGAVWQMKWELQWYKEVAKHVPPGHVYLKNVEGKTAKEVFSEEHNLLSGEAKSWMKDAASSCTVSAALIATIAFAAAITIPGGNKSDSGYPIFSKETAFIIFGVSNALSLYLSTTSLMMFLTSLTRYEEADFLSVLPTKLIIGHVTLFVSIIGMITAFSAVLYLVFGDKNLWILIPVALAYVPLVLLVLLQFPLLLDMIKYTYSTRIFGKRGDRILW